MEQRHQDEALIASKELRAIRNIYQKYRDSDVFGYGQIAGKPTRAHARRKRIGDLVRSTIPDDRVLRISFGSKGMSMENLRERARYMRRQYSEKSLSEGALDLHNAVSMRAGMTQTRRIASEIRARLERLGIGEARHIVGGEYLQMCVSNWADILTIEADLKHVEIDPSISLKWKE